MKNIIAFAIIALAPMVSNAEVSKPQQPFVQTIATKLSDNIKISKTARNVPCYSVVDCREKGQGFTRFDVNGRDFNAASAYPSTDRKWSFEKQGYVLKNSGSLN